MIPRRIHCCWLGGGPKTPLALRCMESWRVRAPGWEIREWDAAGARSLAAAVPGGAPPFFEDALRARKWAFASDWVRFAALFAEGGMYLDCDVELAAEPSAAGEFIAGQRMADGSVAMEPAAMALERGSAAAAAVLARLAAAPFSTALTIGEIAAPALAAAGVRVEILPPEVFCPIAPDGKMHRTAATVGIHHCAMGWCGWRRRLARWLCWHGFSGLVRRLAR